MPKRRRDDPRRIARLRSLIGQLLREAGDDRGAQAKVAARLGVHANTISKALDGSRGPGPEMIFALWQRLGLPVDYFVCAGPDDLDYRQYLAARAPSDQAATIARVAADVAELREAQRRRDEEESGPRAKVRPR